MTLLLQKPNGLSRAAAAAILLADRQRQAQRQRIPRLEYHAAQQTVVSEARRFNVVACGRRWGKTELGMDLAKVTAIDASAPTGWFSPTFNMMTDVWRDLERALFPIIVGKNKTERYMRLEGGGQIDFWSLDNPDMARGHKYARAIVDEAAMIPQLQYAVEFVIRPTLTDLIGDLWMLSTPKGRNYFWRGYQMGQDPGEQEWASWKMPTAANPYMKPKELEDARQQLPERIFAQEYLAEFLEDEGAVFRNIAACMNAPETTPADHEGHKLVAGVDWGKHNDFTVISVGCKTCRCEVAIDRFNQIDYAFQRSRLVVLANKWGVRNIFPESNAMGEPIIEQLHRDPDLAGVRIQPFATTASSKPPLIENLALALEREEWQFVDDPVGRGELEAFERKVSANTGRSTYAAPEGLHDDTVMARALMVQGASRAIGGLIDFVDLDGE
jgi:hypothetical protein